MEYKTKKKTHNFLTPGQRLSTVLYYILAIVDVVENGMYSLAIHPQTFFIQYELNQFLVPNRPKENILWPIFTELLSRWLLPDIITYINIFLI